jgi:hypothetical protein
MSKRLGYETIHTMVNLRREWKLKIKAQRLNASRLINDLLGKYWQHELCRSCLGGVVRVQECPCGKPRIFCDDDDCGELTSFCKCSWGEITTQQRLEIKDQEKVLYE